MNALNRRPQGRGGFTLIEIMVVVAIIALLAAIAVPGFLRARKRSQATTVLNDLRWVDAAVDQYALENNRPGSATVPVPAWTAYLKSGTRLYKTGQDLFGADYGPQTVDLQPKISATTFNMLSDVAPSIYWAPYY